MFCGKCGAKIEEECKFCVCCGAKIEEDAVRIEIPLQPSANEDQVTVMPESLQQPMAERPIVPDNMQFGNVMTEQKPKKQGKKWLKGLLIAASVVIVLAGAFFAFKDYIVFAFLRLMPAEMQYQYIYQRAAGDASEEISLGVGNVKDIVTKDETIKGSLTVDLDDGVPTLLNLVGVDIGKLDKASIDYSITKNEGLTKVTLGIGDGNIKVANVEICVDSERQIMTVQCPELNGDVLEIDLEYFYQQSVGETQELMVETEQLFDDFLPSEQLIEKLIPKYVKVAFAEITNIKRSSAELEANGVTQNATKFEAIIDEDTIRNMLIAVVKEARQDKDIKEYIYGVVEAAKEYNDELEEEPEEVYEELCYQLDNLIDDIEDMELDFAGDDIIYTTYANAKGDIIGIELVIEHEGEEGIKVKLAKVTSGKDVGIIAEVAYLGETIAKVEGNGTENGDEFTGTIDVIYNDNELLSLDFTDFDVEAFKDGYLNGTVEIKLDGIASLVMGGRFGEYVSAANASITIAGDCDDKETNIEISLEAMGYDLGKIIWSQKTSKAEKITIPAETEDDLQKWASEIDFKQIESNLKEVGIYDIINGLGFGSYVSNEVAVMR